MWASVKRDWKWILFALGFWGLLGITVALVAVQHAYRSEAVLLWEPNDGSPDHRVLATQAASLKLPVTLAKVKQRLKLGYPITALEQQIEIWYDMNTNLVTVQANAPTAEEARRLAVTVIDVFLENQKEIARARASDAAKALEKDVKAARAQLAQARQNYDEFRAQNGVTDIESETQLAVTAASNVRAQLQAAQTDVEALGAQLEGLQKEIKGEKPMMVQGTSSSNLNATAAADARSRLATAKARFSADHPEVRRLEAQVAALEKQARTSGSTATGSTTGVNPTFLSLQGQISAARSAQEAAMSRAKSYADQLQIAEQRVAVLTALEGKARAYTADIAVAEKRINEIEVQLALAQDSVRTPPLEFRILTPASLPEWPEKSKRRIIAIAMPIAGMLIALLVLLIRPLRDGRVYTAREAAFWGNMPVVCTSAWPRDRDAFFPLIDELGDEGGGARGFTLVLSVSEHERVLAEELAYWLGGSSLGNDGRPQPRANGNPDEPEPAVVTAAPGSAGASAGATGAAAAGPGGGVSVGTTGSQGHALALVAPQTGGSSALAAYRRGQLGMTAMRAGAHAWAGDREGPALRRAARAADRVLIVLTSGTESFTSLTGLRTRLGRESGIALLLLGVKPELLHLPDRVGDVERFWRQTAARA